MLIFTPGMAIDSMHALYQGVGKKLMFLWFDSSLSSSPFSLRPMIQEIDKLVSNIKPPKFVHRMLTSVEEFSSWKASEVKNWILYYAAPIMSEFMRPDYFSHFMLFISAISILSSDSISTNQLQRSKILLNNFVKDFEKPEFYGLRFCSLNVHQLLHLNENVENLGPLWVHSCFSFENINGQLIRDVHGTTDVESQIMKSHMRILKFSALISQQEDGPIKNFLTQHKHQVKITENIDGCYTVGCYSNLKHIPNDVIDIENINATGMRQYYRLLKNGMLYVSETYRDHLANDSSFAKFYYHQNICFGKIIYFFKISSCSCTRNECLCIGDHYALINPVSITNAFISTHSIDQIELKHVFEFQNTSYKIFVSVTNLITPCFYIKNSTKSYVCVPINKFEGE